jgi:hypothetical protein
MFRRHAIVMSGICVMLMNYLQGDDAGQSSLKQRLPLDELRKIF